MVSIRYLRLSIVAKVSEINAGLKVLKRKMNGKTGNKSVIDELFAGLFESVYKNSSALSGDIQKQLNELQKAVVGFGSDVNRKSDAATEKMIRALSDVVKTITRGQSEASDKLSQRIIELEKAETHKTSEIKKALGDGLGRIEKGINSIPKTDLNSVEEAILELAKIDFPETDLEPLTKLLERPKEWEFEFIYSGNRIDKVIATEV